MVQYLIGFSLIFATIILHMVFIAGTFHYLPKLRQALRHLPSNLYASISAGLFALVLMVAHTCSFIIWAIFFSGVGIFPDWDTSLYFAAVSFTTLGFGDVILTDEWRHLSGLCAANGLLIFGISSASLVEVFRGEWSEISR